MPRKRGIGPEMDTIDSGGLHGCNADHRHGCGNDHHMPKLRKKWLMRCARDVCI